MPSSHPRVASRLSPLSRATVAGGVAALAAGAGLIGAAPASALSPQQVANEPMISLGAHGALVRQLQHELHIRPTGRFGASTRRAVIGFQSRHQLQVDGIVGPQTRDALLGITPPSVTADTASAAGTGTAAAGGGYSIPASIVQCESGGNYSAVNPSSGAGGAYQILPSTWAAYGGQGLPEDAAPAEQSAIAARIYASQGPGAWDC